MTNFIEEFYYGNIDPQARSFEQNKKVQHDMQTLNESEDLHIHSSASSKKDGNKVKNNTLDNIPVLIEKLNENGVNICAITDHDIFSYDMFSALL